MRKAKWMWMVVCAGLLTSASLGSALDIQISITEVAPVTPDFELEVCTWYELPVSAAAANVWIVHATQNITDLHLGTWDEDGFLVAGDVPLFGSDYSTCTMGEVGGPPTVPPCDWKTYWQTLDLWGGSGLEACHYYEISVNGIPMHGDLVSSVWMHPTPEPGTLVLLGTGLMGLAGFVRRQVRRSSVADRKLLA